MGSLWCNRCAGSGAAAGTALLYFLSWLCVWQGLSSSSQLCSRYPAGVLPRAIAQALLASIDRCHSCDFTVDQAQFWTCFT
jgi:hypothetical protein